MKLRHLLLSAAILASSASAFAKIPTGTDPEPGVIHHILHALGLA